MKNNAWPLGIFFAFLVFCSFMIGFAIFSKTQPQELVAKDYYKQELAYQKEIDLLQNAIQDSVSVQVNLSAASLHLKVKGLSQNLQAGRLVLYRPDRAGMDQEVELVSKELDQTIHLDKLLPGRWKARFYLQSGNHAYRIDQDIKI